MSAAPAIAYVDWYAGSRKQNWRTPRALFDELHAEYGFTMDGASEPGNGLLPKASTVETPLPWTGERVFCNPPWSDIPPFLDLAAKADLAVLLVPARTNARWFHRAIALGAAARFFPGRPKFEGAPEGNKGHNSPIDCLLLVFKKQPVYCSCGASEDPQNILHSIACAAVATERTNEHAYDAGPRHRPECQSNATFGAICDCEAAA